MEEEREERRPARRKDRLIQTRVPRELESTLKREARRRRLTVSHLIRNVLEDTFQLVDDVVANVDEIVSDSVELARRVGLDARRMASAVREAVGTEHREEDGEGQTMPEPADPLAHVYAWNHVVSNQSAACSRCGAEIARGGEGYVGLSDDPRSPRAWLCPACREGL